MTGLLIHNKIKRNGWSAIAEPFILQKTTNQTKDNDKMSSESNSAKPVETPKTNKKGFTNNQISEGRVFCKIFIPISVKKEEYKYNNKYHTLDTEELSKNIKIKNINTIVSSISQDMQVNEIEETNPMIKTKL